MKANETNETTTTPTTQAMPSRDEVRKGITLHAAALGCDDKKTVSGFELLLMFLMELKRQGVIPADADFKLPVAIAGHFDSNSSAMTKRLYENSGSAPIDRISAMAAKLSGIQA